MRCLSCFSPAKEDNYNTGNDTMLTPNKQRAEFASCDHGPNMKCLKCIDKQGDRPQ